MPIREPDALPGQPVEIRGLELGLGVLDAQVPVTLVIRVDDQDVGICGVYGLGDEQNNREHFHDWILGDARSLSNRYASRLYEPGCPRGDRAYQALGGIFVAK
jgi:hypothetical protein